MSKYTVTPIVGYPHYGSDLTEELRRCPECIRVDLTDEEINYGHACYPLTTNTQLTYWFQLTKPEQ
jgi:hypothetical protein